MFFRCIYSTGSLHGSFCGIQGLIGLVGTESLGFWAEEFRLLLAWFWVLGFKGGGWGGGAGRGARRRGGIEAGGGDGGDGGGNDAP